jgi:pimeloyl-ACP methyl ester carboxylesterase
MASGAAIRFERGEQVRPHRVASEPLFFVSADCPLYGMYCPPALVRDDSPALVACHGVGLEHAVTSRVVAQAVRQAAAIGYPAFLYHSRGHGDSAGDFADVTFDSLVEDALAAARQVRKLSGARRILWLGLRVGGMVAASAATRTPECAGLVLWEPVTKGSDYFRQLIRGLLFSAVARGEKSGKTVDQVLKEVEQEGQTDIHACHLHAKFYLAMRDLELANILESWAGPTFLAQVQARLNLSPANQALVAALEQRGAQVKVMKISEDPGWQFLMWGQPWSSAVLLQSTGSWLNELA